MNILFIANRFPYPPFRGDKLKIFNLANQLSKQHNLHLITFAEQASDFDDIDKISHLFKSIEVVKLPKWKSFLNVAFGLLGRLPLQVNYFKSAVFQKKVDALLIKNNFDVIHIQHLRMAQYAIEKKEYKRILDLPDAFSLYWERRKTIKRNFFQKLLDNIESKKVLKYESEILGQFNLNLVCSEEDKKYLISKHQQSNIEVLPNGVDIKKFKMGNHNYAKNNTLLFTGNMDYAPNVDAVIYFVKDILPLIKVQFPNIQFIIAGQRPISKVLNLANTDGVQVTGFISDLSEMYNSASIVVAPLRFGAGTQNKVLEAMSMGIPVVCTNIGFEGLGIANGEGAFMRTDAESFAQQVCSLLRSESLRLETGTKGNSRIISQFSWQGVANSLHSYLYAIK